MIFFYFKLFYANLRCGKGGTFMFGPGWHLALEQLGAIKALQYSTNVGTISTHKYVLRILKKTYDYEPNYAIRLKGTHRLSSQNIPQTMVLSC